MIRRKKVSFLFENISEFCVFCVSLVWVLFYYLRRWRVFLRFYGRSIHRLCCIVMEVTVLERGSFHAVTGRPYDVTVDWLINRQDTHLEQFSVLEHGPRVSKQCQASVLGQL